MLTRFISLRDTAKLCAILLCIQVASGCYFFRKKGTGEAQNENSNAVLGTPLGAKAGGPDYEKLEEIYALTTPYAPAAIRPDPDTYVRSTLLQYREEGSTVAREIGRVEAYRPLLGGASEDFSKDPQDRYDATSLLAGIKVAEELCQGLVAPNPDQHPGWRTILPHSASKVNENIKFLAQRFTGVRSTELPDDKLATLRAIFNTASKGTPTLDAYVSVCATLAIDAESLLL